MSSCCSYQLAEKISAVFYESCYRRKNSVKVLLSKWYPRCVLKLSNFYHHSLVHSPYVFNFSISLSNLNLTDKECKCKSLTLLFASTLVICLTENSTNETRYNYICFRLIQKNTLCLQGIWRQLFQKHPRVPLLLQQLKEG